jgi:hypothetical protein
LTDRKSCGGHAAFVHGNVVAWMSKKQPKVSLSTLEAEYTALKEATMETLYLKNLVASIQSTIEGPILIGVDNQACIQHASAPKIQTRAKHIDVHLHFVRDHVAKCNVKLWYVSS